MEVSFYKKKAIYKKDTQNPTDLRFFYKSIYILSFEKKFVLNYRL